LVAALDKQIFLQMGIDHARLLSATLQCLIASKSTTQQEKDVKAGLAQIKTGLDSAIASVGAFEGGTSP
tara:strand:+ start:12126 stop:12332 length:207 start_codon:yes stop_codon:yes gene_type:complete